MDIKEFQGLQYIDGDDGHKYVNFPQLLAGLSENFLIMGNNREQYDLTQDQLEGYGMTVSVLFSMLMEMEGRGEELEFMKIMAANEMTGFDNSPES